MRYDAENPIDIFILVFLKKSEVQRNWKAQRPKNFVIKLKKYIAQWPVQYVTEKFLFFLFLYLVEGGTILYS